MPKLRNRHFFALDVMTWLCTPFLALTLRLERVAEWPNQSLIFFTIVALLVKVAFFYSLQLYKRYWRYANANDLTAILVAAGLSTIFLTLGFAGAHSILEQRDLAMYRTVPLIDGLLAGLAAGGARLGYRALAQRRKIFGGRRILVVGAGEAGTMVVREMLATPQLNMAPLAFVDDDPAKMGIHFEGVPVLGRAEDIPKLVSRYQIQQIIVALPSIPLMRQREIIAICKQTGIAVENMPGIYQILAGSKAVSRTPKIDINRLLNRSPIIIDESEVNLCLSGTTVLVTGAGGSIGSELCRHIARFGPKELILLGHGENSIFEINLDLSLSYPNLVTRPVIADIRDGDRINRVIGQYRPTIIFHAAAHKHVPLMEANVEEAVTNNVLGTHNVLQAAQQHGVDRFVLISTDKAINPTSIMGTTKRLAEMLVITAAHRSGHAYLAVRFGNVLGSRGSVIPVFLQQIAAGGPVTVTHPDMRRYFMTIPEAVQLVLQASVLGKGGEVFVLDMGEPIRIVDLTTDLIKLFGLEPGRDIEINYTGIRPGEKLCEKLFLETENYQRTKHSKIFVATNGSALGNADRCLIEKCREMYDSVDLRQYLALS